VAIWAYATEVENDSGDESGDAGIEGESEHSFTNGFCLYCGRSSKAIAAFKVGCKPFSYEAVNEDEQRLMQEEDHAEAAKWYRKAAEQGDAEAQRKLGDCYARGWVVATDCTEAAAGYRLRQAVKWYRKAAEQNDIAALLSLGHCYKEGRGVPQNEAQAAKYFRRVASFVPVARAGGTVHWRKEVDGVGGGIAFFVISAPDASFVSEAQQQLAYFYDLGIAVPENARKARRWRRKASETESYGDDISFLPPA
jgi:TPR repeat protein